MADDAHWMERAFKPENKGKLHATLGIPKDKKIPAYRISKATHSGSEHTRQMAQAAENAMGVNRKRKNYGE